MHLTLTFQKEALIFQQYLVWAYIMLGSRMISSSASLIMNNVDGSSYTQLSFLGNLDSEKENQRIKIMPSYLVGVMQFKPSI